MEVWKPIAGYEGKYEVSNNGDVKSNVGKGRILKPGLDKCGYCIVSLYKNAKGKTCKVHRLVAQAFIPNPENKPQVDHINRDKTDNRLENLRWVSQSENQLNTGIMKNNTTGYKNIGKTKWGYIVEFNRNKLKYSKRCKTKEEAIAIRDAMYIELG